MNILGISAYFHDSAATLIVDGRIVAAAQEERFTRIKGDARFPSSAVGYCLREGGIGLGELDHVVFYEKPLNKFERILDTQRAVVPDGWDAFRRALPLWARHRIDIGGDLRRGLGPTFAGTVTCADHHESHAASAFFPSPFDTAAIVTLDAVGEWATSSLGVGRGNRVDMLREMRFPHSLGMLYSAFTHYAGFKVNSGEYKLMGLAPYGEPAFTDLILSKLVSVCEDGSLWLDMDYFSYDRGLTMTSPAFHQLFGGPPRSPESTITQRDMNLAASIQQVCELIVLRAARHAHELTGERNLVMAGGVALNCVANGRVLREGPFERVWVQPAAGDAGGSLGAALLYYHHVLDGERKAEVPDGQQASMLGPAFTNEDIGLFLDGAGARYERIDDEAELLDRIARSIDAGEIIGWFHGRMEFGPRALGARSIIGDARSPWMQATMNLKIKFRESFRPFAPCVLLEHVHEVFEMDRNQESPYMLFVAPVRPERRSPLTPEEKDRMQDPDLRVRVSVPRSDLPAITHVDYSARVQTVDRERHGRFYRLMHRFHELSGCSVIVNTSFNVRGEPIVHSPEDAYRCFMATDIDCLVLENHVLWKADQPSLPELAAERYRDQYALD